MTLNTHRRTAENVSAMFTPRGTFTVLPLFNVNKRLGTRLVSLLDAKNTFVSLPSASNRSGLVHHAVSMACSAVNTSERKHDRDATSGGNIKPLPIL